MSTEKSLASDIAFLKVMWRITKLSIYITPLQAYLSQGTGQTMVAWKFIYKRILLNERLSSNMRNIEDAIFVQHMVNLRNHYQIVFHQNDVLPANKY
jgi:hypothetical protein